MGNAEYMGSACASRASPACACPAWSVVMDLLMSCGRRDEHARMLCCRPQLSTACSMVTSRRLAIIMAHSRLGTAERQMWRLHNPCGIMCDGCLLCSGSRTLHTTAVRHAVNSRTHVVQQRHLWSLEKASTAFSIFIFYITRFKK